MSGKETSILLVDDDPDVCRIFELVMRHHQIPYWIANDGENALVYLRENAPSIVVMDIFLPDMDGYQALDHLRQSALNPGCKVVATTAYYTRDTEQEIAKHGFDGYIPKPFNPNSLITYLERFLN